VGSGSITSTNIASGQVGSHHISSGAVTSGAIASGQIGINHIASGAVRSGAIASGQVSQSALSSGAVNSGQVSSGAVTGSIGNAADCIASGTIGPNDFGSGAVLSGAIASGQIGVDHLGSGAVTSGAIASGQVGQFAISSGAVSSGRLGVTGSPTGTNFLRDDFSWAAVSIIASGALSSGSVVSGNIASGQVGTFHFASGDIITYARNASFDQYETAEMISGVRCVGINNSGLLQIAMAAVSGRMPATGVMFANALSGTVATVIRFGDVLGPSLSIGSGLCISGRMGRSLWVGASGSVVTLSGGGPTIGIGATNSGAWGQRIGTSSASGAVLIDILPQLQFSGAANITTNIQQWPI
jgi:hypothetical protein